MDRRTLLTLAASLPALGATRAAACTFALKNPREAGLGNEQVSNLFYAWWDRDEEEFRSYFTKTLMADGKPMDPKLAAELKKFDPVSPHAFDIFDQFFTDKTKSKHLTLIVNTDAAILVACSEADVPITIQPDCKGLPTLHLFAVTMSGLNARSITHISSIETGEVDRFSIWTAGAG